MAKRVALFLGCLGAAGALLLPAQSRATGAPASVSASRAGAPATVSRRRFAQQLGAAAAASAMLGALPPAAFANTAPEIEGTQEGFDAAAAKRVEYQKKQKKFKKAWRKELSNLEFSSNDEEATAAVDALFKLCVENSVEIPEGVRKMDLDQVYKTVQPRLGKAARMNFGKLDKLVRDITTVKSLKGFDELGY